MVVKLMPVKFVVAVAFDGVLAVLLLRIPKAEMRAIGALRLPGLG